MRTLFRILLLIAVMPSAMAQLITGQVRDARSQAGLPGVTVQVVGRASGTQTDRQGQFSLKSNTQSPVILRISSVGYQTREETVTGPLTTPIDLMPTVVQLNQQLVTTNTRTETPDFERPEAVSYLTQRDLRERSPRTVPESLEGVAGVFLQKTTHGSGSPFIRGLTGQQTLLLIDGIRLNNATFRSGPNQYLNTIDPQSVERLEIVRSTGSVAYGSDAIGGVINVLTRNPQFSDQSRFTGRYFGKIATGGMEYSNRAEIGFCNQAVAVTGGLAYRHFGDLIGGRGIGRQSPSDYNQWSGDVKARFRLSDRFVLTTAYQYLEQDSVPVFYRMKLENYKYNQFDPQRRQLGYVRLDGYLGGQWLNNVYVTASHQQQTEGRQSQRNGNTTATYERDNTGSSGLTVGLGSAPAPGWRVQSGIELYADNVRSERQDVNTTTGVGTSKRGLYPDRARMTSLALFSLHTLTRSTWTLTAGGRYNSFDASIPQATVGATGVGSPATDSRANIRNSALVGSLGGSVAIIPTVRLVGSVQSAFRAPNIDDLGTLGIVDFRYETPNASLTPERSLNGEAGFKVKGTKLSASVVAYYNQLSGLISRVRSGNDSIQGYPVFQKVNTADAFIRGVEAEAEWEFWANTLLYGNLAYAYGQNRTANEPLRRIPPMFGRLGLAWQPPGGFRIRAEWQFAGEQRRLAAGDKSDIRIAPGGTPGWHIVNIFTGYSRRNLTISAELHNLSDAAYRTHGSGVDGMGRSGWLSVQIDW